MLAMCADRNRREPHYMRDNSQDHTEAIVYFGNQSPTRESVALGSLVSELVGDRLQHVKLQNHLNPAAL